MPLSKQDVMESAAETLILWRDLISDELRRRGKDGVAVKMHPGNVSDGQPVPHVARVFQKLVALPPASLAKIETYADMLRVAPPPDAREP